MGPPCSTRTAKINSSLSVAHSTTDALSAVTHISKYSNRAPTTLANSTPNSHRTGWANSISVPLNPTVGTSVRASPTARAKK
jgi:hypothetical protein